MIHVLEEGIRKLITVISVRKLNENSDILRYIRNKNNVILHFHKDANLNKIIMDLTFESLSY